MNDSRFNRAPDRRLLDAGAILLFVAVLAGLSCRLHQHWPEAGSASKDRWALASYRDAAYYPAHAVVDGVNPYDTRRDSDPNRFLNRYPVCDALPMYSPLLLLVFAPLAALAVDASMIVFAVLNVALFVALACVTLRAIGWRLGVAPVLGLASFLLLSQPGRGVFFSGQFALPLALATVGALKWGDRQPWRAGALLAFATFKPTFGGPLGLLMAARRDWRAAIGGLLAGGLMFVVGMAIVFARAGDLSLAGISETLERNQQDFNADPTVVPQFNKGRIDLVATLEYLGDKPLPTELAPALALVLLGVTGLVIWRTNPAPRRPASAPELHSVAGVTSALMLVTMFICIYHNVYDLPVLIVPALGAVAAADPSWRQMTPLRRWTLIGFLFAPLVNFTWTEGFRGVMQHLGLAIHSSGDVTPAIFRLASASNGLCLAGAWSLLIREVAGQHAIEPMAKLAGRAA